MKITLVTIRVPWNPNYDGVVKRWIDTYRQFKPAIEHELVVVDSDSAGEPGEFADHASRFLVYTGGGWDCGTWLWAGRTLQTDMLVCCNSSTYFWKHGWLERFVEEFQRYGRGLYGPMTSLAYHPHIRTPCMVFHPEIAIKYPGKVTNRDETYVFECLGGNGNFTLWSKKSGYPVKMVTWDGCYDMSDWRKPDNVFWKGDQSNVLVKDRHANRYDTGKQIDREKLKREADGL